MGNLAGVTCGAAVVYPSAGFDASATLTAVEQERCTALYGVPTMFIAELMLPDFERFDLSSLRTGVMAGAPCPVEVMRQVVERMHMSGVTNAYGMTETSPVSFQTDPNDSLERRVATIGRVQPPRSPVCCTSRHVSHFCDLTALRCTASFGQAGDGLRTTDTVTLACNKNRHPIRLRRLSPQWCASSRIPSAPGRGADRRAAAVRCRNRNHQRCLGRSGLEPGLRSAIHFQHALRFRPRAAGLPLLAATWRENGVAVGRCAATYPQLCAPYFDAVVIGDPEDSVPRIYRDFCAGELQPLYRSAPTIRIAFPFRVSTFRPARKSCRSPSKRRGDVLHL